MAQIIGNAIFQALTQTTGLPLAGGKVFTYTAGTSTPLNTFTDSSGATPNANPTILNSSGQAVIYWDGLYKVIVKDSADVTLYTYDNVDYRSNAGTLAADLLNSASIIKGAALVGFDGTTLDQVFKLRNLRVVTSITALRALDKTKYTFAYVSGYYASGDGGGGVYYYDAADTTSADNTGTIIVASDAGRWKLAYTDQVSVKQFGAKGDNTADDTAAFQKVLDIGGVYFVPAGTYKITAGLKYKVFSTKLIGNGRDTVTINFTGTTGPVFANNVSAATTLLWCELSGMKILATAMTTSKIIVDWKSFQFGQLNQLWLNGPNTASSWGLNIEANWAVTEGTYNVVRDIYIGNVELGIRIGDGGNSNQIIGGRIQVGFAGGYAVQAAATVAGRVSNLAIYGLGMEYPGNVSSGINLTNVDGAVISGCRFEALNVGILVDSTTVNVQATRRGNYFSGLTTPILATARQVEPACIACVSFDGTTGAVTGTARGCTVVRTGVGLYTITLDMAMRNAEYSVQLTSSGAIKSVIGKTTTTINLSTQTVGLAAQDHAAVDMAVFGVS